jgi:hypothetical protein
MGSRVKGKERMKEERINSEGVRMCISWKKIEKRECAYGCKLWLSTPGHHHG